MKKLSLRKSYDLHSFFSKLNRKKNAGRLTCTEVETQTAVSALVLEPLYTRESEDFFLGSKVTRVLAVHRIPRHGITLWQLRTDPLVLLHP